MLAFVYTWKEIYVPVSYTVMLEVNGIFFFFLIKVLEDPSKNINHLKMFTECRKPSLLRNNIFHKDKNIASM